MSKTKELVAAGHALAKELHCADSAALVRELATQLDVQLVRGNQLEQQLAAVVAENAGLKESRKNLAEFIHDELNSDYPLNMDVETPATDATIANIQAQGVEGFLTFCGEENSVFVEAKAYYRSLADAVDEFAAQLRQGSEL